MTDTPTIDVFAPGALDDPYPLYARLRREAPVFRIPGTHFHLVSTAELVAEATTRTDDFSSNLTGAAPTRASTFTYLVAADYAWKDWLFSGQLSDRRIAGHRQDMAVAKRAAVVMFSATGSSHQGRMAHRLAWTLMTQNGDGHWLQWRSSWQFDDRWQVEATVDLLQGRESGFIGQFRDRDRGRIELRYQF